MKKRTYATLISILFSLFLVSVSNAQGVYGKLYRKTQADSLYGPVLYSYQIPTSRLKSMLSQTSKVILFRYDMGRFLVADNTRKVLSTSSTTDMKQSSTNLESTASIPLSKDATMRVFSVSKVQELTTLGMEPVTVIEQRQNVISITNGSVTLEMSATCPPICY